MTTISALGGARPCAARLAWARRAAVAASVTVCALLPVAMVLANKSAPVALALGSVLANLAALLSGQGRGLGRRYVGLLRQGPALLLGAVLAWAALSLVWTISPAMTIRGLRETLPEVLFGWGLAAAWPLVARRGDLRWLVPGILGAGALIAFEAAGAMPLHHLVGARALPWDLKRSSIPPLLLLWPAFEVARPRGRSLVLAALVAAAAIGSVASHSSASVVAILLGLAVYGAAQIWPRAASRAFAAAILMALVSAPWTGTVMTALVSEPVGRVLEDQHALERVVIWNVFENRVWERTWLGHGFDASFRIGDSWNAPGGRPIEKEVYGIHPHNQFLQIWIDFGLVGALMVLAGLAVLMGRLRRLTPPRLAPRLAFLASATMMGLVGVQAWDAWWLATLAVCWCLFSVSHPAVRPAPAR